MTVKTVERRAGLDSGAFKQKGSTKKTCEKRFFETPPKLNSYFYAVPSLVKQRLCFRRKGHSEELKKGSKLCSLRPTCVGPAGVRRTRPLSRFAAGNPTVLSYSKRVLGLNKSFAELFQKRPAGGKSVGINVFAGSY